MVTEGKEGSAGGTHNSRKVPVYDLNGKQAKEIELPEVFSTPVRLDLIKRAVLAIQSANRQPYAADVMAGKRSSAHYHGERATRYSMMNKEMARGSRIHNQGFLNLTLRIAPHAVKGRGAHPPKLEKIFTEKINKKERQLATLSAISASANFGLVSRRHRIEKIKLPIIFEDSFQALKNTKDVVKALEAVGLKSDLERAGQRKIRSGRGKMRGRKYKNKIGPIIVIAKDEGIGNAARNIQGVNVAYAKNLNSKYLAPGCMPRLSVWSESAIISLRNARKR
ncbi:MAG: 50S ribosomal protein L4 [Candidatus Aenigmatarchaeota archaeon]